MESTAVAALSLSALIVNLSPGMTDRSTMRCRDRLGYFTPENFKISTCSMCYFYMIKDQPVFMLNKPLSYKDFHTKPFHLIMNDSESQVHLFPLLNNQTVMDLVCSTLDDTSCHRWKSCCTAAWKCCESQMNAVILSDTAPYCPQTFDGWLCWSYTRAGGHVSQHCPDFLSTTVSGQSVKFCSSDGTWFKDNSTGLEYTDYDSCLQKDGSKIYQKTVIACVVLNTCGIILVLPAILIFICNRGLRKQQHIQIHINLFLSILVSSCVDLLWDIDVRLDRLASTDGESTLYGHQGYCRTLHVLYNWSRSCIVFWMTCEGHFLHRLLANAFLPPKHLNGYFLFGWAVPSVLMIAYSITRISTADDSVCWLLSLQDVEWTMVYVPPIVCILANVIFLVSILKQLLTKMVSHPNEPSSFRKAVRATFTLIPLFGLHQFCLIYRPSPGQNTPFYIYEFIAAIIMNSYGIIISLLFCYFNNEVKGYIKNGVSRLRLRWMNRTQKENRKMWITTKSDSRRISLSTIQVPSSDVHRTMNGVSNSFDSEDNNI